MSQESTKAGDEWTAEWRIVGRSQAGLQVDQQKIALKKWQRINEIWLIENEEVML